MIKMNKKFLVLFIIILLGLTVLSAFTLDNDDDYLDLNRSTLNISAGGYPVDYFVESLNKEEYYRGHDEKTKLWLIGLSGNQVYSSGDYYVGLRAKDACPGCTFFFYSFACSVNSYIQKWLLPDAVN